MPIPDLNRSDVNQPISRASVLQTSKHKSDFHPNLPRSFALSAFPKALMSTLKRMGAITAFMSRRNISLMNLKCWVNSGYINPKMSPEKAAINNQFDSDMPLIYSQNCLIALFYVK
jgi:hypothetical protein